MSRPAAHSRWPRVAEALAAALPRERLHPAVVAFAEANPPRERWAVALSGGADSVALLLLLWAHWPERRRRLVALHFDHRLRGRASTTDAKFCAKLCAALGVACDLGAWTDRPANTANISEARARAARMEFFTTRLARRRLRVLFLGHQLDDVAETLLMRLGRGSGTAGLAAPRPVHEVAFARGARRTHLRPLLDLRKRDLIAALSAAGARWRDDASNETDTFLRNRIRTEALPAWAAATTDRDAFAGAALSRALLEEDDVALETWADEVAQIDAEGRLDLRPLAGRPRALWRRVLRRWLATLPEDGDLSRQGFDALLTRVERGGFTRFSLGSHGFAVVRRGHLRFEPAPPASIDFSLGTSTLRP